MGSTWVPHGKDGWYIGPVLGHYCCYTVYINKTRSERVVETVEFTPTEVQPPFQSTRDLDTEATNQLTYALVKPQPAGPFTQVGDDQLIVLKKLAAIFEGAVPKHKQQTTTPPLRSNTSESPQRVDCTESPHKELMTAAAPRVVKPTSSNKKKPKFPPQTTNHATEVCNNNHTTSHDYEECRTTQHAAGRAI
jgi:hypothetical protein